MTARYLRSEEQKQTALEMALSAIEGRPSPLDDPEMARLSPEPGSLDLLEEDCCFRGVKRSKSRRIRRAVGVCRECGRPLSAPARPRA